MPSPQPSLPASPLAQVLAANYDELVGYVRRHFAGRDFAQDVVHSVCVQVLERPPADEVRTPLAFLRRAVMHQALDHCRSDRRRTAVIEARDALPEVAAQEAATEALISFRCDVQALTSIVQDMPARARQVFLLHGVHGMTHLEIAQAVGISRSMVSHQHARAMRDVAAKWEPIRSLLQPLRESRR